jgi:hypothetical protein
MDHLATRIPAGDYAAILKPRLSRSEGRARAGVTLVLRPPLSEDALQTYHFSSWDFVRERLLVFGLATPEELDSADVRLSTGRQPYMFSVRRWEAPLIEALDLIYSEF